MSRPERRRSSLAGTSPLTPIPAGEAAAPRPESAAVLATPAVRRSPAGGGSSRTQAYPRLNYYVEDAEEAGRIRAAFLAGRATYGWRTFSQMQRDSMIAVVEQIERQLNDGQRFEPAGAGAVPPGRSVE